MGHMALTNHTLFSVLFRISITVFQKVLTCLSFLELREVLNKIFVFLTQHISYLQVIPNKKRLGFTKGFLLPQVIIVIINPICFIYKVIIIVKTT